MSASTRNKPPRFERKFRIEDLPLAAVRQAVQLLPWSMRPLHPDRHIHNIYFDTPDLDAFHENAAGAGLRKKYRLRWYGAAEWPEGSCRLEIKRRDLGLGEKQVQAVDLPSVGCRPTELMRHLQKLAGLPAGLHPVLHNTYHRSYFGSSHPKCRITIDWDLRFSGLLLGAGPINSPGVWIPDSAVILEVKYDTSLDEEMDAVFQNWPFRMTKHSKYVRGMELCYER